MWQPLIIFLMQLSLLPIVTLRTILLVKGETRKASVIGVVEAAINVLSLGIVFQDMSNIWNIIAYAIGFGAGLMLGGVLENKLAIGYVTHQINLLDRSEKLVNRLRAEGFGVTVYQGEGREDNARFRIDVLSKRSREKELLQIVNELAPKAFLVSFEIRSFKGGYLTKSMKKKQR
ncbi:DUF2179 domain-containing protein [Fictibacillus enclensis]|uniref:UPF0316 protein AS030_10605 n=1 Tax=Fictibacillus enclensis TaxID=1017270 RepID=A0A0V8J832_9BACL|nr:MULTISPECIES: DUF2179 domain-containing protein [Fictibacillus]KSU83036.1 hypothetical protein AS030_10605 [Fictibacillus enclensis]MDM5340140.1 DUF2179 domain-containing protein [Fictibacillus enclensis]RXZ01782.1 DUF2179 domain-containing protein [Fictibacillus sp. S7]SCC09042.1 Uncharacterized protein YebE, UPF0316 family [Fictibacillus enclensis]